MSRGLEGWPYLQTAQIRYASTATKNNLSQQFIFQDKNWQYFYHHQTCSCWCPTRSCLSPLLYLVYTNDIPTILKASVVCRWHSFPYKRQNPSRAIIQDQQFSVSTSGNYISTLKKQLLFSSVNTIHTICIFILKSTKLHGQNMVNTGGVHFDSMLSFKSHITNVTT